jgi:hypothetical protein
MSGPPPTLNFPNQYSMNHAQVTQMQQQLQLQQLQNHQQHELIQQLHRESRERRDKIRNKPFPSNVSHATRDRQARGKDVYGSSSEEEEENEKIEEVEVVDEEEGEDEDEEEEEEEEKNKPIAGRRYVFWINSFLYCYLFFVHFFPPPLRSCF